MDITGDGVLTFRESLLGNAWQESRAFEKAGLLEKRANIQQIVNQIVEKICESCNVEPIGVRNPGVGT
jgi:hypothetical protein